jgi:hypothetical protein
MTTLMDRAHQALIRAEMAGDRLRWSCRHQRNFWLVRRAQRRMWARAETFLEVCNLMARFCEGELVESPYHAGPRDPETVDIGAALAHANRKGFLTIQSQPGADEPMDNPDGSPAECGARWEQRAAVEGFASLRMVHRLAAAIEGTRLLMQVGTAENVRRIDRHHEVVCTRVREEDYTAFGAVLARRDIQFMWDGRIREELVEEMVTMCQVMIYDPMWGDERLLWDRLWTL